MNTNFDLLPFTPSPYEWNYCFESKLIQKDGTLDLSVRNNSNMPHLHA